MRGAHHVWRLRKEEGRFPLRCSDCRPEEFDRLLKAAATGQQGVDIMFVVLPREKIAIAKAFSDCPFRESVRKEEPFRFHYRVKAVFAPNKVDGLSERGGTDFNNEDAALIVWENQNGIRLILLQGGCNASLVQDRLKGRVSLQYAADFESGEAAYLIGLFLPSGSVVLPWESVMIAPGMAHLMQENMSTNLFILDEVVGFGDVPGLRPVTDTRMMKGS